MSNDDLFGLQAEPAGPPGFPVVNTSKFVTLIDEAVKGGDAAKKYFDVVTAFSRFFDFLYQNHDNAYVQSKDADNTTVVTASDGNVFLQLRVDLDHSLTKNDITTETVVGTANIHLGAATNGQPTSPDDLLEKTGRLSLKFAEIPDALQVDAEFWAKLQLSCLKLLTDLVKSLAKALRTPPDQPDNPLDSLEINTRGALQAATAEKISMTLGSKIWSLGIDWSLAFGTVMAASLFTSAYYILGFLEKKMTHELEFTNETGIEFEWDVPYYHEGTLAVEPVENQVLPKQSTTLGGRAVTLFNQADYHFMNTSGLQGLGYVFTLTARNTEKDVPTFVVVVDIPFFADNSIWVGQAGNNPDWPEIYRTHAGESKSLSSSHVSGQYTARLSIDKLKGTTEGSHDYRSVLVISGASS